MRSTHGVELPVTASEPPVRLRYVLLLGALALAVWELAPRASAAWRLHNNATLLADYALCMVGPTGPSLLRDEPEDFWHLARRRVVLALPKDKPFQRCANSARTLSGSPAVGEAHQAAAWDFVEHGGSPDKTLTVRRIDDLRVSTQVLEELTEQAWPFVRDGYTALMVPSSGAREAPHPLPLPQPVVGSGLPAWRAAHRSATIDARGMLLAVGQGANTSAYRSRDGVVWKPASVRGEDVAEIAGRCRAAGAGTFFSFGLSDDGSLTTLRSMKDDGTAQVVPVAPSEWKVEVASCDADAALVGMRKLDSDTIAVKICHFATRCETVRLPALDGESLRPRFPLDLARVAGANIVAVARGGIVRVASSRDDGRSWTPYAVAFDAGDGPRLAVDVKIPNRLLAVGEHVVLFGGTDNPAHRYPQLVSDDLGASWRGSNRGR